MVESGIWGAEVGKIVELPPQPFGDQLAELI
jgi:hypothetical protein